MSTCYEVFERIYTYNVIFHGIQEREGPFMNGRRKCERVAYDAILDRYAVLYI